MVACLETELSTSIDTPDSGFIKLFNENNQLRYKLSDGSVRTLSTGVTPEEVQDIVGAFIQGGTACSVTYDDNGNVLIINVEQSQINTSLLNNDAQFQSATQVIAAVNSHANLINNPHSVTKSQVGLGNVDNTSDINKPISNATQNALDSKANTVDLSLVAFSNSYNDLDDLPVSGGDIGRVVAHNFFTNTFSFTNNDPTFVTVYSYLTPVLQIGEYVVKIMFSYEGGSTGSNDIFKIAEGITELSPQVDLEEEPKDTGTDIKMVRTIVGKLSVSASGQKTINLRGAQDGSGVTTVKGAYFELLRVL
jgi:hypothetical protein